MVTPKASAASAVPARKITPTASKVWKDNLRRACLDRARSRRRRNAPAAAAAAARYMVEEELRQQGIALRSPCTTQDLVESADQMMEVVTDVPKANHFISEDELFELLEEVEEEIERTEAERLDDMIQQVQNEQQYLEDQIVEYEKWEENNKLAQAAADNRLAVPCPICQDENLLQSDNHSIVCPNHMDGSCTMQLDNADLNLIDLQAIIQAAFEAHSASCHDCLSFHICEGRLLATCAVCETLMTLV